MSLSNRILLTTAPAASLFIRIMVGAVFLLVAFAVLFSGATTVGWVLTWMVTALAFINLTVQFCAGCFIYLQLDRRGLLPASIASSRAAH